MRITSIALENIKSYQKIEVPFTLGTTAIRGHNGAGKSTLVEAIGFALFDSMNYSQDQFVREGERYGVVTVSFISAEDDREYQAVRRCGSSPTWFIYDPELQMRVVEQKVDVNDFLRRHLRIEAEISLRDLFNDALGIPQGTFTADFLLTPANRKRKFDTLLQIEDYRKAADRLNETRLYLQEERHAVLQRIGDLKRETGQLDEWRAELAQFHEMSDLIAVRLQELQQESDLVDKRLQALQADEKKVETLKSQAEASPYRVCQCRETASYHDQPAGRGARGPAHLRSDLRRFRAVSPNGEEAIRSWRADPRNEMSCGNSEPRRPRSTPGQIATCITPGRNWKMPSRQQQRLRQLVPGIRRQEALERERDDARKHTERAEETAARLEAPATEHPAV